MSRISKLKTANLEDLVKRAEILSMHVMTGPTRDQIEPKVWREAQDLVSRINAHRAIYS